MFTWVLLSEKTSVGVFKTLEESRHGCPCMFSCFILSSGNNMGDAFPVIICSEWPTADLRG